MNKTLFASILHEGAKVLQEEFTPPQPAPPPAAPQPSATPTAPVSSTNVDELVDILNTIRSAKSFADPATYNSIGSLWGTTAPETQATVLDFLKKLGTAATETLNSGSQTNVPTQQGNGLPPQAPQQAQTATNQQQVQTPQPQL